MQHLRDATQQLLRKVWFILDKATDTNKHTHSHLIYCHRSTYITCFLDCETKPKWLEKLTHARENMQTLERKVLSGI